MARAPRLVGIAEIEVAQRAADGDLADGRELAERAGILLQRVERARDLALLQLDVALAALVLRQGDLAAARLGGIQDAVAQRLLAIAFQRAGPAAGKSFGALPTLSRYSQITGLS